MKRIQADDYKNIADTVEAMLKREFSHFEKVKALSTDIKFGVTVPLDNHEAKVKMVIAIREKK